MLFYCVFITEPLPEDTGLYTLKKFCDIDDDIHKQACESFGINPQEIEPNQEFDKEVGEILRDRFHNTEVKRAKSHGRKEMNK